MSYQFYYYYIDAYRHGYQYISTYPKFQMLSMDKYQIEYIPDYPSVGDTVLLYININYKFQTSSCNDCILSGYFTNEKGVKNTLFKDSLTEEGGFKFVYPGKPVEIIMEHQNSTYKFFVPLPSWKQSLNLALNDSVIGKIISPLFTLLSIVLAIVAFMERKLLKQRFIQRLAELKMEILKNKSKKKTKKKN